jgi:CheY-like chemotaxis protein
MDEHILVVDDNRDAADGLARLIAGFGYPVQAVYDGEQAVAVAATFAPDMALIDIGMPGLDGFETVKQIRKQRAAAQVILVAVTGRSDDEDKRRAYECGFDLFEPKPLGIEKLRELLHLLDPDGREP